MISVSYLLVAFTDVSLKTWEIPKLRGYFANKYPSEHLFHNHLPSGQFSFTIPKIQYRIHDGHPALLGFKEGLEPMKRVFLETEEIIVGAQILKTNEISYTFFESDFGQDTEFHDYRFISPWMALNQENYREYVSLNPMQQKQRLKQILKGNLLTLSKGFSYTIPNFDEVEVDGWFKTIERKLHGVPMQCFTGEFSTNFMIPNLLGLGKQSARGFGVIQKM